MLIQEVQDQKNWNNFLLSQPTQSGIFLQSWEWGEFQKAVGRPAQISDSQKFQSSRRVYRFKAADGSAQVQVIELPLPFGKRYWFIPRGMLIEGLEEEARRHGVLFVRFEPPQQLHVTRYTLHVTRPVSPPQTLLIDLTKSEDELLAEMHEKTRYNVRLALRKGIRNQELGIRGFEEFWKMMEETAKRDKFRTHPREYYEKMLEVLHNPSQPPLTLRGGDRSDVPPLKVRGGAGGVMSVRLHLAYSGPTPLAAAIVGYFGDTATYLHGASSYEHRALMGPYGLHWEIMKDAKARGYKFYDFWGINLRPTSYVLRPQKWSGMTRFKIGFGGQVVDYPGTFDLPIRKFWYTLYRFGRRLVVG